jgi:hypothetical protein
LAQPGAGQALAQLWPTGEGDGAGARERRRHRRAHTSARAKGGGGTALRSAGAGEPAERGRKAGRRWARRRFAAGGPVLGPRGGGLARAGAGDPRGGLIWLEGAERGLSAGRWWSSATGIAAGGLWVRDWGGEVVLCVCGSVRKLLGSLNRSLDQRRGREKRRKNSPERGKTAALRELRSGEGRRGVAEAGAGKEVPGSTFL